jgi:2-phosphosulfolactate phosphatase
LEGSKQALGITVIIDVFRAGNTILSCFHRGAHAVIPVGELEKAYQLKEENPSYCLAGERNSYPPKGFDFGNSPSETLKHDLHDKTVILTTSAGTQGIVHAGDPRRIFIATFGNAHSAVKLIQKLNPDDVSLVAMGFGAQQKAEEDEMCAWYLEQKLKKKKVEFSSIRHKLLQSKGAERLRRIGRRDDLDLCLQENFFHYVPAYDFQKRRLLHTLYPV